MVVDDHLGGFGVFAVVIVSVVSVVVGVLLGVDGEEEITAGVAATGVAAIVGIVVAIAVVAGVVRVVDVGVELVGAFGVGFISASGSVDVRSNDNVVLVSFVACREIDTDLLVRGVEVR